MKTLIGSIMIAAFGLAAYGQQAKTITPVPAALPKVLAEVSASSSSKIVKGSPFSAEAISESTQTLADGNRIVRKWTEKLYRSGDGRFRREGSGIPGSVFGGVVSSNGGVTILDPTGGARYTLNTDAKTAYTYTLKATTPVVVGGQMNEELKRKIEAAQVDSGGAIILNGQGSTIAGNLDAAKVAELKAKAEEVNARADELRAVSAARITTVLPAMPAMPVQLSSKWETRTEQLGTQNFDGVDAEGTRTITTIPADAIGNERPIEIVYERWYSNELQVIVYSKHSDPRFGEQTYRLTNINRSEPDPSLFQVPTSYRLMNPYTPRPQSTRATVERVSTSKSAQASRP
jgi:hypothetical protein